LAKLSTGLKSNRKNKKSDYFLIYCIYKAMRPSLSCASSFVVSYLDGFASIAAFIQAAPLLKSFTKIQPQSSPMKQRFVLLVFYFFSASSGCLS
jgi:hypothetical protein